MSSAIIKHTFDISKGNGAEGRVTYTVEGTRSGIDKAIGQLRDSLTMQQMATNNPSFKKSGRDISLISEQQEIIDEITAQYNLTLYDGRR